MMTPSQAREQAVPRKGFDNYRGSTNMHEYLLGTRVLIKELGEHGHVANFDDGGILFVRCGTNVYRVREADVIPSKYVEDYDAYFMDDSGLHSSY